MSDVLSEECAGCATEKVKPWLVGLAVLVVIVIVWMILEHGGQSETRLGHGIESRILAGSGRWMNAVDSYHDAIESVMPSVVGIGMSTVQPFLQGWQAKPARVDSAWLRCPQCGPFVMPDIVDGSVTCPKCFLQVANLPRAQRQVWNTPAQPSGQTRPMAWAGGMAYPLAPAMPGTPVWQPVARQGFKGIGSGVIVSKSGHILTNSHLVSGQKSVTVTLFMPTGQRSVPGRVLAQAADRDLAIVKIDPQGMDLPVAPIGDSSTVREGDTVIALGNPFGLSQTATSGIVSAMRGSIVVEGHTLTNVIQTDAPVNQGSSGGPLVNLRGEVIGINTAIYSPMITHTGLGFTVPINQATQVFGSYMSGPVRQAAMRFLGATDAYAYPTAVRQGRVPLEIPEHAPPWLGLNIQILNGAVAEQLGIPLDRGILVNQVYRNSPAAAAGMKRGDVILRFDGRKITDETQIRALLGKKKPGDVIKLSILRGRKRHEIKFETAGGAFRPAALLNNRTNLLKGSEIEAGTADIVSVGITASNITPEVAFMYGLHQNTKGVAVIGIEGLSNNYGMKEGDVIKAVDGRATDDLVGLMRVLKVGDLYRGVSFIVERKGQLLKIVVKEPRNLGFGGL